MNEKLATLTLFRLLFNHYEKKQLYYLMRLSEKELDAIMHEEFEALKAKGKAFGVRDVSEALLNRDDATTELEP